MDLSSHIKELILLNDAVILRNIGGFETVYREAVPDEENNIIRPPGKEISFHPEWTVDNGVLEEHLATVLHTGREEASDIIDEYAQALRTELDQKGLAVINHVGELIADESGNLTFKPFQDENFFAGSFGLDTLEFEIPHAAAAVRKRRKQRTWSDSTLRSTFLYFILGFLVFMIFLTSIFIVLSRSANHILDLRENLGGSDGSEYVTLGSRENSQDDTITRSIEQTLEEKISAREALSIESERNTQTISDTKTFYIVAGSFRSVESAEVLRMKLRKQGFEPIVLVMGENVRVIIGTFGNKDDALTELRRLRSQYDQSVWLLEQ